MKTTISVPDTVFDRAERRARELRISRSELYSKAVEHWLDAEQESRVTEQIDEVLAAAPQSDDDLAFLARAASRLIEPDQRP